MKAASNRVGLYYKAEANWGETPAGGAFTQLRYTGETLDRSKNTQRSNTIREDRMTDELAVLGFECAGDIDFELSYGSWDAWLAQVLCGAWVTLTENTLTLTVAAAAKTITRAAGSFLTDGLKAGALVKFGGFATPANNAKFLVTHLTATVATVEDPGGVLVDEVGPGGTGTYDADFLQNGVLTPSLVIEKHFSDINKFQWFNGLCLSGVSLDVTAQQLITGKFNLMGKDSVMSGATVSASYVDAVVNKIMSASTNVGRIVSNGTILSTGLKSIKVDISNDLRKQDIIGSQATGGIGYGGFLAKGTVDAYFEDTAMVDSVIAHSKRSLNFPVKDADGKMLFINLPALYFTKGNPKAQSQNQDVMVPLEFETIRDADSNSMITISRFAA